MPDQPQSGEARSGEAEALGAAAVLSQLAEGVIVTDGEGRIVLVNEAAERLHGVKRLDVPPSEYTEAYHLLTIAGEPYPADALPLARAVQKGETVTDARWRIRRPDGSEVVAVGTARPLLNEAGEQRGAILTVRDDTARYEDAIYRASAEQALRAERDRSEGVLQHMAEGFALLDRDYRIVAMNAEGLRLDGRPREELIGKTHWEAYPAAIELGELYKKAMAERVPVHREHCYAFEEGRESWLEMRAYPLPDQSLAVFYRDVSARHATEKRLRESEERYHTLFDRVEAGFCIIEVSFDPSGRAHDYRFIEVNPAFARQTGLTDAEGKWARELVPGLEQHWFDVYGRVALRGEPVRFENVAEHMDGRWFDVHAFRIGEPEARRVALLFNDISERRRSEAALRESEARLRALTDHLPGGMVYQIATGADGSERRFLYVSQSHEQLTGIAAEQVLADPTIPYRLIHPDDQPLLVEAEGEAIRSKSIFDLQARFMRSDGELRWSRIISEPREQADGSLIWDGIQIDITEQKAAEEALRLKGEEFYTLADNIPALCWMAYPDGHIFWYNRRWYDYTGTSADSQEGWGWESVHDPAFLPQVGERWARSLKTGTPFEMTFPLRGADGVFRPFLTRVVPIRNEQGKIVRWFGTNTDVTEQHAAEEALRESEAKFQAIANSIDQMVWSTRPDGYHDYFNDRWYDFTGVPPGSTDGEGWNDLFHPADQDRAWAVWRHSLNTGEIYHIEYRLRHRSGEYRWVLGRAQPMRDSAGRVTRWFGTCTDIQEIVEAREVLARSREELEEMVKERTAALVQAQEQLRQSQKLEAMGQLTGGVAHDFNNLLTPIVGSLDLLHRRGLGGEREQRLIDGALQSAERAKTLVQRLLAFARRQPLQPSAVDIGDLVRGMADLVASTSGPQVKVVVDVPEGLPPALADQNQLEMAILNLSVNARDAMPDGGTLTVSAACETVQASHRAKLKPGDYVRLSVADTGVGMDEATLARAVEPFFSTKGIGKGTGLGLSMVHGLASQLGGSLVIASKPGLGTQIELWLPVSAQAAEAAEEAGAEALGAKAIGTALLVDDEELVRATTADMLDDMGYEVVEAASAEEALKLLGGGLRLDLLVTDHLMPGMTGVDLAREVRQQRPGTPVLIVSGYAEAEAIAPDLPRLTKPFRQADMAASLAEVMARQG